MLAWSFQRSAGPIGDPVPRHRAAAAPGRRHRAAAGPAGADAPRPSPPSCRPTPRPPGSSVRRRRPADRGVAGPARTPTPRTRPGSSRLGPGAGSRHRRRHRPGHRPGRPRDARRTPDARPPRAASSTAGRCSDAAARSSGWSATRDGAQPAGVVRRAHRRPGRPARRPAARGGRRRRARPGPGRLMEVVPITVGVASRAWDEQHLDVAAAAEQVGGAGTGGFTAAVSGPAARFSQRLAAARRRPRHQAARPGRTACAPRSPTTSQTEPGRRSDDFGLRALPRGAAVTHGSCSRRTRAEVPPLDGRPGRDPRLRAGPARRPPPRSTTSARSSPATPGSATGRAAPPPPTTRRSARSARRADAMSLALRGVHQRADDHADEMEQLVEDRADLETRRGYATRGSRGSGNGPTAPPWTEARRDPGRVRRLLPAGLRGPRRRPHRLAEAGDRRRGARCCRRSAGSLTVEQVEQQYGGVADPADAALAAAAERRHPRGGQRLVGRPDPGGAAGDHRRLARLHRQPRRHPAVGPRRGQRTSPSTRDLADWERSRSTATSPTTRRPGWRTPGPPRRPHRHHRARHRPGDR